MTIVKFYTTENGWQGFEAIGHTNFSTHGEDIVCAAVSALTQTTVLGLQKVLGIDCLVQVDEEIGALVCVLPPGLGPELWHKAQLIFQVLHIGLMAIAEEAEYKKHVSVKEVPYRENESTTFRLKKRWRKHKEW